MKLHIIRKTTWNNGQQNRRGMLDIMIDALLSHGHYRSLAQRLSGIEIAIILGKRTGRDHQADAMANFKDLSGVPTINSIKTNMPRFNQRRLLHAVAETRPHHTIAEALTETIRPDINEHRHKI